MNTRTPDAPPQNTSTTQPTPDNPSFGQRAGNVLRDTVEMTVIAGAVGLAAVRGVLEGASIIDAEGNPDFARAEKVTGHARKAVKEHDPTSIARTAYTAAHAIPAGLRAGDKELRARQARRQNRTTAPDNRKPGNSRPAK